MIVQNAFMMRAVPMTQAAAVVAQATLAEHCSEGQREALLKGELVVLTKELKRYRIRTCGDRGATVMRDCDSWHACVGTHWGSLPAADCMLAAKLLLEADEAAFVHAGNKCGNIWLD